MATQFQNRLIGTVILVSLGVIFLPDLLMGKKNDISAPPGSLPLRPEQTMTATPETADTNNVVAAVSSSASASTNSNNTSTPIAGGDASSVNDSSSVVVASSSNDSWQVEEVAPTVTIGQSTKTVVAEKNTVVQSKPVQTATAKTESNIQKTTKPVVVAKETKPVEVVKASETVSAETETTVQTKKDESGLTIKTPAQVEAERLARQQTNAKPAAVVTSAKPVTTTEAVTHNGSWIIQVGVFSNAENAKSLANRLRSAGYTATTVRSGSLTRVVVGPDVSRDKLQSQLSGINRAAGTSGRVIPYSAVAN